VLRGTHLGFQNFWSKVKAKKFFQTSRPPTPLPFLPFLALALNSSKIQLPGRVLLSATLWSQIVLTGKE